MSTPKNSTDRNFRVLSIAIMFALFFMIAFVTGYQNPLGTVIKGLAGDNTALSQLGNLANFIAYAVMGFPAGKLLERHGYRITSLAAVTVGFVGVLITFLSGFITENNTLTISIYLIGAFISGFSMCMLNTVVNPMLNSLGRDQRQGNQLIQFGGMCNSLGATLAPVIVGYLIGGRASSIASANGVFYMAMAIFAVAAVVIYASELQESPDLGKEKESLKVKDVLAFSNLRFGLLAIFCYVGIEVGIANWNTQYLVDHFEAIGQKADATTIAGAVVGVYWLLMLVGRLVGGIVGGMVSSRAMLTTTAALLTVLVSAAICVSGTDVPFISFSSADMSIQTVQVPLNAILLVLCGLCTSVMWGAIFNLAVEGLGRFTSLASGLFMVMVCGGGILPFLQGYVSTNILSSFWLIAGLGIYLLIYALLLSKPDKKAQKEKGAFA